MGASLGRHSGATLVGRPLDISVRAVLNAQDDIANLCLEADVFYADNRLDKSRVRVTAEKASVGSVDAVIRIRASIPVDEPVVTVYVRVSCQQKIERRYVMLADMPSEAIADRNATSLGASPAQIFSSDPALPARAPPNANRSNAGFAQNNRDANNTLNAQNNRTIQNTQKSVDTAIQVVTPDAADGTPKIVRKSVGAKQLRDGAAIATGKSRASNGPRLKLEPLDLSFEREPQLKSSSQLLSAPSTNPQERLAAAALWRAITSQPQDILRDFEKLQSLESSVRSLQAQSQKSEQSIQELGVKLQKAESGKYVNALVYTLGFLLLLAIAAVIYILQKQLSQNRIASNSTSWWRRRDNSQRLHQDWADSIVHEDDLNFNHNSTEKKRKSKAAVKDESVNPEIDLDVQTSRLTRSKTVSGFQTNSLPPQGSTYHSDFALSMAHPSRAVKAEELFDVNQQADFFVSIGQHEQAIEVLRNHINDDVETSVLVYLDLFNLYHQLARKDDYAALRENFNGHFNTKIPVFELYSVAGPGLEVYQLAMSRIEALWPSPKVLEVIEDAIFNRPENDTEAFNLVAYRDLLLLYSVAKEIISFGVRPASAADKAGRAGKFDRSRKFDLPVTSVDRADWQPVEFVLTSIQPLSASIEDSNSAKSNLLVNPSIKSTLTLPHAFPGDNAALDIDLSEPMPIREKRRSNATINAADTEFLKNAQSYALGGSSLPATTTHSAEKLPEPPGNLIAFDAFNNFDRALSKSEKFKPSKM